MVTRSSCRLVIASPDSWRNRACAPSLALKIELFDVVLGSGSECDPARETAGGFLDGRFLLGLHEVDHGGVRVYDHGVARELRAITPDLAQDFVSDGRP